jgi:RadC-like JAB domain
MAKKVSVAYEDPRFSRKEAAYFGQVRRALDEMGAPNSGELLHNSKTYVEGVARAGLPPVDAAAVIWHKHCNAAGTAAVPCVAEDSLVSGEPWVLLHPGFWEWQTNPYPPGGYAIAQKPRKAGFELGRWDSRIGRPSFAALAIYPTLEAAQNGAAMYANLPGGRETAANEISLTERRVPGSWYLERRKDGKLISLYGPWHSEAAAMGGRRSLETVRRTDDGSVLTLPLLAVRGGAHGARECSCDGAAECPPGASEKRKISHTELPRAALDKISARQRSYIDEFAFYDIGGGHYLAYYGGQLIAAWDGHAWTGVLSGFMSLKEDSNVAEARDSAPACVPFTRLERNNEAFAACQAIANGPLETDADMYRLLQSQLGKEDQEVFVVIGVDLHRNLRSYTEIARGQRDRVAVNVEDVLRAAILDGPHGFVVAHNHPSGQANPSPADRDLTRRIKKGASEACPNIVFLDHIVVGQNEYFSFEDNKLKKVR